MIARSAHAGVALKCAQVALAVGLATATGHASAAATIIINNINAAGVGFNDATPAAPVGGNTGTTLGQQRLIAFSYAANLWGATLTSAVPIIINAQFSALSCTATSATLGSAGATNIFRDFPNAPKTGTWYSQALANKLAGVSMDSPNAPDINANFNVNLGQPGCLTGTPFYLGLDGNQGTAINFVEVLLHEMGHGIGFQTFTNGSTGAQQGGFPSIWDWYLLDTANGPHLAAGDRGAARGVGHQHRTSWYGAARLSRLRCRRFSCWALRCLQVSSPASVAGNYEVGTASFGPALSSPGLTKQVMPVITQIAANGNGCDPFNAVNTAAVAGRIALIDRGVCGFTVKVKNAQNAGAVGVIIADNAAGSPPAGLGGADPTITIPSVRITLPDGNALKAALATRSRTASAVVATLGVNLSLRAGANAAGQIKMYAPIPFAGGSSVSHYDVSALPNQLMEPAINADLTQSVMPPQDLTFQVAAGYRLVAPSMQQ